MWSLWYWQNQRMFSESPKVVDNPVAFVQRQAQEFHYAQHLIYAVNGIQGREASRWVRWIPPIDGRVKINCDGASCTRTGKAAAGGVIRDGKGNWLLGFTQALGCCSAFDAELWAVFSSCKLALDHGYMKVQIDTDSTEVVAALKDPGYSMVASALPLYCRLLLQKFDEVDVSHVFRETNQVADSLAKASIGDGLIRNKSPMLSSRVCSASSPY